MGDNGVLDIVATSSTYRSHRRWAIIVICLFFQALIFGVLFPSLTFFIESWARDFNVVRSQLSFALVFSSIGTTVFAPFVGRALDSLSIRMLISGGLGAFALATFFLSLAATPAHVLAVYAVFVPFALLLCGTMPSLLLAARWFPDRRGLAIGLTAVGISLGGILCPPVVHVLIAHLGWRAAYQVASLIAVLVLLPLVLLIVRDGPPSQASSPSSAPTPDTPSSHASVRSILLTPGFWFVNLCVVILFAMVAGTQVNLAAFALERQITLTEAAGLLSALALSLALAKVVWGGLADRVDHRLLFIGAAGGCALACVGLAFASGGLSIGAWLVLLGLSGGGLIPLHGAAFAQLFGTQALGRATGLANVIFAPSAVGAPLMAFLNESWGGFEPVMLALAVAAVGAGLIVSFLRLSRPSGEA